MIHNAASCKEEWIFSNQMHICDQNCKGCTSTTAHLCTLLHDTHWTAHIGHCMMLKAHFTFLLCAQWCYRVFTVIVLIRMIVVIIASVSSKQVEGGVFDAFSGFAPRQPRPSQRTPTLPSPYWFFPFPRTPSPSIHPLLFYFPLFPIMIIPSNHSWNW